MKTKETRLITYLKKENYSKVTKEIKDGCDVNVRDEEGYSLLHWSIIKGQLKIIKLLVENGVDTGLRTIKGLTPIELAIYVRQINIFKYLIKFSSRKERAGLLHTAAALNAVKILDLLIRFGGKTNGRDISGRTPLHWAAQEGALDAAKILVKYNAKINLLDDEKYSPLAIAASEGHLGVTRFLLENGANVHKKILGGTILHLACAWNQDKIVKLLLNNGARINMKNDQGDTPLHVSVDYCYEDIVRLLLLKGAKFDVRNNDGKNVLDLAAECSSSIRFLLERSITRSKARR